MTSPVRARWVLAALIGVLVVVSAVFALRVGVDNAVDVWFVADDPALPDIWGPDENIAWSIDVPGLAWSSPVVCSDYDSLEFIADSMCCACGGG